MLRFYQYSRISFFMTFLFVLLAVSLYKPTMVQAGTGAESSDTIQLQHFLDLEIEGISLSTLPEDIPVILEAVGYSQTGNSTFIKNTPLPGGRKSIYRIELEDTPQYRSITYFRGESGGRNKSPVVKNKPVPDNEAVWANAFYKLVCLNVPDEIKAERSCQPLVDWQIRFGEGRSLDISDKISAQLDASGASTILGVTYFKD